MNSSDDWRNTPLPDNALFRDTGSDVFYDKNKITRVVSSLPPAGFQKIGMQAFFNKSTKALKNVEVWVPVATKTKPALA